MMGFTVTTAQAPIVKTTNCILAPTAAELPPPPPAQPCIRCGLCAEACPASLLPQQLFWFAQGKEIEKLEQHKLFDCIECGACSWVGPSHIPLVQYYRASKADILEQRREHAKSEQARQRFEARQVRLAQEEEEREAKRAARKAAAEKRAELAAQGDAEDPIQAAIERAKAKKAAQQYGQPVAASVSPEAALRQKLAKAEQRLAQSVASGEDTKIVSALEASVERLKGKLAEAESATTESGAT